MKNEIQITPNSGFSLVPRNLDEAMKYAEILAKSTMVPRAYQNKPGDILIAVQMGAEIGLKPLQALQNIATINGKPSVFGDAALALVKAHPSCEDIIETFDAEKIEATCIAKRKGQTDVIQTFDKAKATKAKLWEKVGPWTDYPERMLQMRARSYALRDQFPDVLQGLILTEEAQDYTDVTPTHQTSTIHNVTKTIANEVMPELSNRPITLYNNWLGKDIDLMPEVISIWIEGKLRLIHTKSEMDIMESFLLSNKVKLSAWIKMGEEYRAEYLAFHSGLAEKRKEFIEDDEEAAKQVASNMTAEEEPEVEMEGDSEYQEAMRV